MTGSPVVLLAAMVVYAWGRGKTFGSEVRGLLGAMVFWSVARFGAQPESKLVWRMLVPCTAQQVGTLHQ